MSIKQIGKNTWKIVVSMGNVNGKYPRICETFKGLKSEALLRESELKKQAKTGSILINKKMTFKEFSEKWLQEYAKNLAPRTYNEYRKLLKKINTFIGMIPLCELKPIHLTEYYNKLREIGKETTHSKLDRTELFSGPLSENTILHHYTLIGSVLNKAVDWECLEKNPNNKVPRPRIEKYEPKFYDVEQVQTLLRCLENEPLKTQALILLALDTGARRGEITGLNWEDIDFEKAYITINKTTQLLNGKIIEKSPKTKSSIRKVPITLGTVEILKRYRTELKQKELLLGSKWEKTNKVFTGEFGGPMYPQTPSDIFRALLNKYNLPKIKFHELRHTSVSLLINAGIQTQLISKRVGHSSISTTSNIYAHIFNSSEKQVAETMGNLLKAN